MCPPAQGACNGLQTSPRAADAVRRGTKARPHGERCMRLCALVRRGRCGPNEAHRPARPRQTARHPQSGWRCPPRVVCVMPHMLPSRAQAALLRCAARAHRPRSPIRDAWAHGSGSPLPKDLPGVAPVPGLHVTPVFGLPRPVLPSATPVQNRRVPERGSGWYRRQAAALQTA